MTLQCSLLIRYYCVSVTPIILIVLYLTPFASILDNVTADPAERHDLSGQLPGVVKQLRKKLMSYNLSATSSAQQGLADDERGNPRTRTDGHNGTVFPWVDSGD